MNAYIFILCVLIFFFLPLCKAHGTAEFRRANLRSGVGVKNTEQRMLRLAALKSISELKH